VFFVFLVKKKVCACLLACYYVGVVARTLLSLCVFPAEKALARVGDDTKFWVHTMAQVGTLAAPRVKGVDDDPVVAAAVEGGGTVTRLTESCVVTDFSFCGSTTTTLAQPTWCGKQPCICEAVGGAGDAENQAARSSWHIIIIIIIIISATLFAS
jgi:hypothetical protein